MYKTKKYYQANKPYYMERAKKRQAELRDWYREIKAGLSCQECGESHPATLQFHHRDPAEKELSIAGAMSMGWSKKRVLSEIDKCDVLCANCHAKKHYASLV